MRNEGPLILVRATLRNLITEGMGIYRQRNTSGKINRVGNHFIQGMIIVSPDSEEHIGTGDVIGDNNYHRRVGRRSLSSSGSGSAEQNQSDFFNLSSTVRLTFGYSGRSLFEISISFKNTCYRKRK